MQSQTCRITEHRDAIRGLVEDAQEILDSIEEAVFSLEDAVDSLNRRRNGTGCIPVSLSK